MNSCPQAALLCSGTPEPSDIMYWFYSAPAGTPTSSLAGWTRTGQACLAPSRTPATAIPAFTVEDFRRLPLPPGAVRVQPPDGRSLVNIQTNLYVQARTVVLPTTLIGLPVQVRATPVSFRWTYGDGSGLVTADPGRPYPGMTTTHVYRRAGTMPVRLTTAYRGEYSVSGGPWLPVDGQAEVASPLLTLQVYATRAELVAGTSG